MLSSKLYADTPPQEFLDRLHKINIPELYDASLSKEQRLNLISYKRDQLKDWQQRIDEVINIIDERHDAAHQQEAKLAQAPYELLATLGKQLRDAVDDLEKTIKKGRVLPEGFQFGQIIYGEPEWGEWHLGTRDDRDRFDEMVSVKSRLDRLKAEYQPLIREMKLSQARINELKNDLREKMSAYNTQRKASYIAIRLLLVFVLGAVMIGTGYYLYTTSATGDAVIISETADLPVAGALLVGGVCAVIVMIVLYRRRNRRLDELKTDIQAGRQRLSNLQATFKKQRSEYYPLQQLMKDLNARYKSLRRTFPSTG